MAEGFAWDAWDAQAFWTEPCCSLISSEYNSGE